MLHRMAKKQACDKTFRLSQKGGFIRTPSNIEQTLCYTLKQPQRFWKTDSKGSKQKGTPKRDDRGPLASSKEYTMKKKTKKPLEAIYSVYPLMPNMLGKESPFPRNFNLPKKRTQMQKLPGKEKG